MSVDSPSATAASAPRRSRFPGGLIFLSGVSLGLLIGLLIPLGIAYYQGPRSTTFAVDPLTGRHKVESTWLGITTKSEITETPVSVWADQHGLPKLVPGNAGWVGVTMSKRSWFGGEFNACWGRGGQVIPAIMDGRLHVDGQTPEETFRQYQGEYIAAHRESGAGWTVLKPWLARIKMPDDNRQVRQ